ncbi:MAG: UDP-N-acetylmuramate dehydrogenase [Nocardioidaceae bacterium]
MVDLRELTTLRLGGPAGSYVRATTEDELVASLDGDVLLVAGGSNLVVADAGFPGTVVHVATTGVRVEADQCSGATVTAAAGEPWDGFVARAVAEGWAGLEALSGIPGTVGATPIQNVGAYGQEVAGVIARVRTFDRAEGAVRTFGSADCGFGYRTSRFKAEPGRYVVLEVTFQLPLGDLSMPIGYAELASVLGVEIGARASMAEVRSAVLELRRAKGMVLDERDFDTWSVGSFFTNPFVSTDALPAGAPAYPQPDGRLKTSAAWLIEQAGFSKGYGNDRVSLSTKHTLALTNRGTATTADLLALATEIRDGVRARFGITLIPEPTLVGCALD